MIDQDSTEFTEAFVSAVRPGEPRGRPGWWMAVFAVSVAFAVALASLLNGALGGGKANAAAGSSWTAVAGPGCTNGATTFTKVGYQAGTARETADWTVSRTGGYTGSGCTGGFVSLPLSGHAQAYDGNRYALWTFRPGTALRNGASCQLATYIPDDPALSAVGGEPARYYYYGSAYAPGSTAEPAGGYSVSQVDNRGKWVLSTSFSVTSGQVSVRLLDAGTTRGARAAAAQVRLTCSAK